LLLDKNVKEIDFLIKSEAPTQTDELMRVLSIDWGETMLDTGCLMLDKWKKIPFLSSIQRPASSI